MLRRDFVIQAGRTAAGASLLFFGGCVRRQGLTSVTDKAAVRALIADLEGRIPELMSRHAVPGASMAIVHEGQVVWRHGFGVRDATSRVPVDDETVFEVGSVSKTVFAYVVMKLCENGTLDLDTPLVEYAPFRVVEDDPRSDLITARHVLSHTTGLPNWRSRQEPLSLRFRPGEQFLYSGEGYSYLQSVVTHLTGRVDANLCGTYEAGLEVCATDFDQFMRANVLGPFGMASSGYVWNDRFESTAARPHDPQGQPGRSRPTAVDAARYGAAGGLLTTAGDYAKFLLEITDPEGPDAYRLSPAGVAEMLRPQVRIDDSTSRALGWEVQHGDRGDIVNHGGNNPGFIALGAASPSRRSGFVIMTNSLSGYGLISGLAGIESMQRFLPVRMPE